MTLPTIAELKDRPDEVRRMVAEVCGWKREILPEPIRGSTDPDNGIVFCLWTHPTHRPIDDEPGHDPYHGELVLPNYTNSHDACRTFEDAMSPKEFRAYITCLYCVCSGHENINTAPMVFWGDDVTKILKATPLQKCLALLVLRGVAV